MSAQRHVLAAIDLDVTTGFVLQAAIQETLARPGAKLLVLYVMPLFSGDPFDARPDSYRTRMVEEVTKRTREALALYVGEHPGTLLPEVEIELALGRPAREIVALAARFDVDLVLVGSHGRRGLSKFFSGSVSEKVVRRAGCPVIVVRDKHHDPTLQDVEIEPLCPDCATTRFESRGHELWCARHAEHHAFGHGPMSSGGRAEAPSAWSSMTGT
jgi:nucleotide-binding universal stress UspA family protein